MEKTCTGCGEVKDRGAGFDRWDRVCRECRKDTPRRSPQTAREARAEQIVAWWAEDLTVEEISRRLGYDNPRSAASLITDLRQRGYNLPYRTDGGPRGGRARSQKLVRPRGEVA